MNLVLPNNPGLSRRNAYGEYIRKKNKNIGRSNGSIGSNDLTVNIQSNNTRSNNRRNRTRNTNYLEYSRYHEYIMNNLSDSVDIISDMSYETLVELPNIAIGLNLEELINNSKVKISNKKEFCVICQEYIQKNNIIRVLKCTHNYHINCIENWLKDHYTCPLCKKNLKL